MTVLNVGCTVTRVARWLWPRLDWRRAAVLEQRARR